MRPSGAPRWPPADSPPYERSAWKSTFSAPGPHVARPAAFKSFLIRTQRCPGTYSNGSAGIFASGRFRPLAHEPYHPSDRHKSQSDTSRFSSRARRKSQFLAFGAHVLFVTISMLHSTDGTDFLR